MLRYSFILALASQFSASAFLSFFGSLSAAEPLSLSPLLLSELSTAGPACSPTVKRTWSRLGISVSSFCWHIQLKPAICHAVIASPIDAMASKLPNQLRAVYTFTSHYWILSRGFPNRTNALRELLLGSNGRCFSNAPSPPEDSSSPPTLIPPPSPNPSAPSSLNQKELAKFSAIAETWWDSEGPFKPLHAMNPTRSAFIRSTLCRHFGRDPCCARPFEGLNFVDVGCGGGILSEPLARMGATVTGIDAVEKNIKIARLHADLDPSTSTIEYCCTTAEKLVEEQRNFDAVISLEVIEHVADPAEFCKSLAALTVPNGATVISTINRSMRAYATAVVAAEYILHWLPKGTHQWSSFLTPEELVLISQRASISVKEVAGFAYNPLTGRWSLSDDISVNFIAYGTKTSE